MRPSINFGLAEFEFVLDQNLSYHGACWFDIEVVKIPESKDFCISTPDGAWRCKGEGWKLYDS